MRHSAQRSADVVWIAGSVDGGDAATFAAALNRIAAHGNVLQSARPVTVMRPPENRADSVHVPIIRIGGGGDVAITGFDQDGRRILEGTAMLDQGGKGDGRDQSAGGDPQRPRPLPGQRRIDRRRRPASRCPLAAEVRRPCRR